MPDNNIQLQEKIYQRYTDTCIARLHWMAPLIAIAQIIMAFLDFNSGFFAQHSLNYLNLLAEVILIVGSCIVCFLFVGDESQQTQSFKVRLIVLYRISIMAAIILFMFTDVYVRHTAMGTYMIFLFVLQITPAYKTVTNWVQFGVIGALAIILYSAFVSHEANTMFGTVFIFFAFAVSTNYLRSYFTKQLKEYFKAEESNLRFQRLSDQTIVALSDTVEAKDLYTKGHSQRVANYSAEIARRLGYDDERIKEVYYIGLMHDIGKIGVPDSVINKKGRLTDEEFAEIKNHPGIGYDILKQISEIKDISEGARWHHERFDGRGYPDGLAGEDIPVIARIIAVADAYDAMTSNRSYRNVMEQNAVYEQIQANSGTQFDPEIAKVMLEMIKDDTGYSMRE